jgi:predicted nucleotidyltransferase
MNDFADLIEIFTDFPEILLVIVFGSVARKNDSAGSDLDIAVAGLKPLPMDFILQLQCILEKNIGREVDVIDLQKVSGPILQQVLTTGKIIKNLSPLYANLIKKMWFNQADMMPLTKFVLQEHCQRFVNG